MVRIRFISSMVGIVAEASSFDSTHWAIEKYTLNVKTGTGLALQDFLLRNQLCDPKTVCPTDLGCGGLRSWCIINTPYPSQEFDANIAELHFVETPVLHDSHMPGTDGLAWDAWQTHFEDLNGNMTRFNAFMHNKAQFFTLTLDKVIHSLRADGVPLMLRESADEEGQRAAHVAFAVAGRIFEYIGDARQVPRDVHFEHWKADECAEAHALPATLSHLAATLHRAQTNGNNSAPLFVGVGVSSQRPSGGGSDSLSVLYKHLRQLSGVHVRTAQHMACEVASLSWPSMPGFTIRYVRNDAAAVGKWDLGDFDRYVAQLHTNFTAWDKSWKSWDHMLDQHVGLWYGGPAGDCAARANLTRSLLVADDLAVSERHEPDAHLMYVGYVGPMTWEYQFSKCDAGRPDWPKECACDPDNNADNMPGGTCPGQEKPDGWCQHAGADSLLV